MENHESETYGESHECCHYKKIFMLLVLMILSFIAGIMVGCCRSSYNMPAMYGYQPQFMPHPQFAGQPDIQKDKMKPKKFQRGAHPVPLEQNQETSTQSPQNIPIGGFIVEVDDN